MNAFVTLVLSFAPGRYFGFPGMIVKIGAFKRIFSIYFRPIFFDIPGTLWSTDGKNWYGIPSNCIVDDNESDTPVPLP